MKPAVIVVDMLKDNVNIESPSPFGDGLRRIIPAIQGLLAAAREKNLTVVYANDSFLPNDFLFRGAMKPHAIRGTPGAGVIDELTPAQTDMVLPKRRFSAFFKTDLDITLRELGIDTVAVCGITTEVCVNMTVMDGIAHDFRAILLSDCCASRDPAVHDQVIERHRRSPVRPLIRVMTSTEFLAELE